VQSDAELIQQCRSGQPEAFRIIIERYQSEAFGHALTLLGHREDALDSIQDAFLSAYQAIDRFDVSREFYPWLYVILRNRCLKQFEVRSRRREVEASDLEHTQIIQAPDRDVSDLEEALRALPSQDREIISLKYLDGLKYAELADRLSIPTGTVMSRLYHARQRLRELLKESEV
jgi:RNA polymerase sigma-70 factor, ECF subfamily